MSAILYKKTNMGRGHSNIRWCRIGPVAKKGAWTGRRTAFVRGTSRDQNFPGKGEKPTNEKKPKKKTEGSWVVDIVGHRERTEKRREGSPLGLNSNGAGKGGKKRGTQKKEGCDELNLPMEGGTRGGKKD